MPAVLLAAFVLGLAFSITLSQTALVLLTVRWLLRVTRREHRGGWLLALPLLAWLATSLLAAGLSGRPAESALVAVRGFVLVATFYVVLDALDSIRDVDWFLGGLGGALAVVSLVALLQVSVCPALPPGIASALRLVCKVARASGRSTGFFSIYMTLAGVLSLVLLATLPRVLFGGGPIGSRRWWSAAWLLGAAAFALTYVRGAWVGFLAGIIALILTLRRERAVVAAGAVLVVLALLAMPGVLHRAESIADPTDPTARERVLMWKSGLAMVRDHPFTGVGPGQVKHEYRSYASPQALQQSRGHLHNTPLQILVERGPLGLLAWLWIFFAFFRACAVALRDLPPHATRERTIIAGSAAAILGFLVGGLTEYNFGDSEVVMVAYAVMALPFVVTRDMKGSALRLQTS